MTKREKQESLDKYNKILRHLSKIDDALDSGCSYCEHERKKGCKKCALQVTGRGCTEHANHPYARMLKDLGSAFSNAATIRNMIEKDIEN